MDYQASIVALYQGEVYGEHLFNALAEAEEAPQVAAMWRRVADVERLTGARVKPLAARFDADLERQERAGAARAVAQIEVFAGQGWREILTYFRGRVPANVARLEALVAQASNEDEPVLRQFVAHSRAFDDCARCMLDDDPQGAMDALQAYLSA